MVEVDDWNSDDKSKLKVERNAAREYLETTINEIYS